MGFGRYIKKVSKAFKPGTKTNKRANKTISRVKSTYALAKQAYSGFKYLRGMINCEKKFYDISGNLSINNTGDVSTLSGISQGDDTNQRNGDSILAKYLDLRFSWVMNAADPVEMVRTIVFQDTMSLGTVPAVGDVLTLVGTSTDVLALLNLVGARQHRFKILHDESYTLCSTGTQAVQKNLVVPLNDHIKFTGTVGSDEGKNIVYILNISSSTGANKPTVTWKSRLAYYDN